MEMGERIKLKRKECGLTQVELARMLGLKDSAIAKYENGRVENIKRSTIQSMAKIFGCSPTYLLGLDEEKNNIEAVKYSSIEKEIIRKYRAADDNMKKMVHLALGIEGNEDVMRRHA